MAFPDSVRDRERDKFNKDIDGNTTVRVVAGKDLHSLFNMVNSPGFLDGEVYDGYLVRDNVTGFKTFHFFFQGSEIFQIILGDNAKGDIGAIKEPPGPNIIETLFVQGTAEANEPVGSLVGVFFSIGGTSVIYTIVQDLNNSFELLNNNRLHNTVLLEQKTYTIVVRAMGDGGTEFINSYDIVVSDEGIITNINLSNRSIEATAPIGTSVGGLSTNGGQLPIVYSIIFQRDNDTKLEVDIFEIAGNTLQSKASIGVVGTNYEIFIKAQDDRSPDIDFPDKDQTFLIESVIDTFLNSNSLSFNGVDEHLEAPDSPSMGTKTKFTLLGWINPVNTGANQYITSKFGAAGQRSFGLRIGIAGTLAFVFSQNGVASDTKTSVGLVNYLAWNHYAIVFDGTLPTSEVTFYMDGVIDSNFTTTLNSLFNSNVDFLIGALYDTGVSVKDYFEGFADEIYYHDDAFDAAQVAAVFNLGVPKNNETLGTAATMVSGLRMGDDFTGGIQPDLKGNNDFTGIGMNNSNKSTDVP